MKALKLLMASLGVLLALAAPAGPAWAHDGHGRGGGHEWHGERGWHGGHDMHGHFHHRHFDRGFGFVIGAPALLWPWDPWFGDYPPPPPVEYIEKAPPGATSGYWYYCANPPGYYPNVRVCQTAWQKVAATPPPPPPQ